ncbi:MAG: pseudaminic acid biosynthesis-associated methylase [Elainellaceae cyanobacterium]
MGKVTEQMSVWSGQFGQDYTDRNLMSLEEMESTCQAMYGMTMTDIYTRLIGQCDRAIKILEVACNVGNQLLCLQQMGFARLYGIELQQYAVEIAKSRTKAINIIQATAFDIPFKDQYFDLVFTSGLLIHISPDDIAEALTEIYRCSSRFIMGCEYFSPSYETLSYRDNTDLLWKTDFASLYLSHFPDLKLVQKIMLPIKGSDNLSAAFLLEKT